MISLRLLLLLPSFCPFRVVTSFAHIFGFFEDPVDDAELELASVP